MRKLEIVLLCLPLIFAAFAVLTCGWLLAQKRLRQARRIDQAYWRQVDLMREKLQQVERTERNQPP